MTIRDWVPTRERDLADDIVENSTVNPDAPLEYASPAEREVWLVDEEATRAYVEELQENPAWFRR